MVNNPCEVNIRIRLARDSEPVYFIGNCDMDVNLKDTVLIIHPPIDGRNGKIIIRSKKVAAEKYDDYDNDGNSE